MAPVCFVAFLFLLPIKKYPLRKLELPEGSSEASAEKANPVDSEHATATHVEQAKTLSKFSIDSRTEFATHFDVIDGMDLEGPESPKTTVNSDANMGQAQYNTVWFKQCVDIVAKDKRRSSNRRTM
jgi:hypothetical protein